MDNLNINMGTSIFTYKFPKGIKIHYKKGDTLDTKVGKVLIIETDEENGIIKAMLLEPISVEERLDVYKNDIDKAINKIASIIHKNTSDGLFSKVGWNFLPNKEKIKYTEIATNIIQYLNNEELLLLDLSYIDR